MCVLRISFAALILLGGCGPRPAELRLVDSAPVARGDWPVSTPEDVGLDPLALADLYHRAAGHPSLYGLLVVKDGTLIAEDYFNDGGIDEAQGRQSVTKSFLSALVGIGLLKGCMPALDTAMLDWFPEFQVRDSRKRAITIEQMLTMSGGYPHEEKVDGYLERLYDPAFNFVPLLVEFDLSQDPGDGFQYSNATSHLLGVILARSCDTSLEQFARSHLFEPMGAEIAYWAEDADGYNFGLAELYVTARDMAKFGQMYLDRGRYDDQQIVPESWVAASLAPHYQHVLDYRAGRYFRDVGYGYQWWTGRAGPHEVRFAWGHGGNFIVLVPALHMVIVTTADPLYGGHDGSAWQKEKGVLNLVGRFVKSLPATPVGAESGLRTDTSNRRSATPYN